MECQRDNKDTPKNDQTNAQKAFYLNEVRQMADKAKSAIKNGKGTHINDLNLNL